MSLKLLKFFSENETVEAADAALTELRNRRDELRQQVGLIEADRIRYGSLHLAGDDGSGKALCKSEADLANAKRDLERLELAVDDVMARRDKALERERAGERAAKVRKLNELLARRRAAARKIEDLLCKFAPEWLTLLDTCDAIDFLHADLAPDRERHAFAIGRPLGPDATLGRLGRLMVALKIDKHLTDDGAWVDFSTKPGSFADLESDVLEKFKIAE